VTIKKVIQKRLGLHDPKQILYSGVVNREQSGQVRLMKVSRATRKLLCKRAKKSLRRIFYKSPNGNDYEFLTNDFTLMPDDVAFLYLRRWDKEKCFDTCKNTFSCSKAW
jgi:hypothetical protein